MAEIGAALAAAGERAAYAVRSSATAEDSPGASSAGQQETYLNVTGRASILAHVSRCWASLYTERAVTYRMRNGIGHREVEMAVVVQQMVFPQAAGVLFTADPVGGNRKVSSVEAVYGLGEALVSGRTTPDAYKVRGGEVIARTIGTKLVAISAVPGGGTQEVAVETERQEQPALTDAQVVRLAQFGRDIEAHFGTPQDIEWCLLDDEFYFVQSRPVTTLFPIPQRVDRENHVYLSVGHQQMMTDAMKPLGISFWQMTTTRPMFEAGGRLFVDVTQLLGSPATRSRFVEAYGKADPLTGDALRIICERGDFIPVPREDPEMPPGVAPAAALEADPAIVQELIEGNQASVAELKTRIRAKSGPALIDFIAEDLQELRRLLFNPKSTQVFMTAIEAAQWLNDHIDTWLGEKNAADAVTQSVPNNVTSEMGLALLEVADAIRPYPDVIAYLQHADDRGLGDGLAGLDGGEAAHDAIWGFLEKYGMRCVGEIDITKPRWSEHPAALVPVILANIRNFEHGAGRLRFERGLRLARERERDLLARLRLLPDGESKAREVKSKIDLVRTFIGYREYPKFGMISRYFVYKQALLHEAEELVRARVLAEKEDIFYLNFDELGDVVRTGKIDDRLIRERKEAFKSFAVLTPPRVLTSEGEAISGFYHRDDLPPEALAGLAVSAGTVEGRARVVLNMADASLEPGDILVTRYTDPSWTPLFVTIKGLVTEVGGLMTHGAVIAREYGLPAVVGVEDATTLIRDGQWIRVHGSEGYVEVIRAGAKSRGRV